MQLAPWLLSWQNRLRFEFVSHKLMRLLVPILLLILLFSSGFLANRSLFYMGTLAAQIVFYLLAALGSWPAVPFLARVAARASAFCMLYDAVVVGFYIFLFTLGPLWKIWSSGALASIATDSQEGAA